MAKRPIELEDLLRFNIVTDVQLAPCGTRVAFVVKSIDAEKNKTFSRIWLARRGEDASPFTGEGHNDRMPRWSPDGRTIAFVSNRNKPGDQIYTIAADGGEAVKCTSFDEGSVDEMAWSPDGSRLAVCFRAAPDAWTADGKKGREETGTSNPVRVHTRLFYRLDAFGYYDDSYSQVWTVDPTHGTARRITDEPCTHHAVCWSPDSHRLAWIANNRSDSDLMPGWDDIWSAPAEGGPANRISAPDGPKETLVWDTETTLYCIGNMEPLCSWGGANDRVIRIDTVSGEWSDLTGSSDLHVGYSTLSDLHEVGAGFALQAAAQHLWFPVSRHGSVQLYRCRRDGSELTPFTQAGTEIGSFSITSNGGIAIQIGSAQIPHRVRLHSEDGTVHEWSANPDTDAEIAFQKPQEFWITSTEGARIQGWLLQPPAEGPHPCILYVHGGPAGQYGDAPFHELQWLAAQGFVVVYSNPRGSKGYGEAHTKAIEHDWGNRDWQDIQAAADYAASLACVDADRMAIMGGSYGGYMSAWAVGHTDRFRCAVIDRLVGNLHSMAGTCDFPWLPDLGWKGNTWDSVDEMWNRSPLKYAGRINTPVLIIHSDGDLRCPVSQAEELFAALRVQRKPVEFVRYPAESSHGMSRNGPPDLRLDRLRRNLAFLQRHLMPE